MRPNILLFLISSALFCSCNTPVAPPPAIFTVTDSILTYGKNESVLHAERDPNIKGASIELYGGAHGTDKERRGSMHFISEECNMPDGLAFDFINHAQTWTSTFRIYKNGKVAIGDMGMNASPNDYNLFVDKGILTEKIKVAVKNSGKWADHVFSSDYRLMPIGQLAAYALQNKHLPGIPSAADAVKNGVDLGEMNVKLLQKVEELTLYMAQQQKEIDELKKELHRK